MTDLVHRLADDVETADRDKLTVRTGMSADALRQAVSDHLVCSIARHRRCSHQSIITARCH